MSRHTKITSPQTVKCQWHQYDNYTALSEHSGFCGHLTT